MKIIIAILVVANGVTTILCGVLLWLSLMGGTKLVLLGCLVMMGLFSNLTQSIRALRDKYRASRLTFYSNLAAFLIFGPVLAASIMGGSPVRGSVGACLYLMANMVLALWMRKKAKELPALSTEVFD